MLHFIYYLKTGRKVKWDKWAPPFKSLIICKNVLFNSFCYYNNHVFNFSTVYSVQCTGIQNHLIPQKRFTMSRQVKVTAAATWVWIPSILCRSAHPWLWKINYHVKLPVFEAILSFLTLSFFLLPLPFSSPAVAPSPHTTLVFCIIYTPESRLRITYSLLGSVFDAFVVDEAEAAGLAAGPVQHQVYLLQTAKLGERIPQVLIILL